MVSESKAVVLHARRDTTPHLRRGHVGQVDGGAALKVASEGRIVLQAVAGAVHLDEG